MKGKIKGYYRANHKTYWVGRPEIVVKPVKNQVDDLMEEIRVRIEQKNVFL